MHAARRRAGRLPLGIAAMIGTLLIANRGEIACRIARTARRLGIRTVAVYSDVDAGALHVEQADTAVRIGPAPAAESYLDVQAIIGAARRVGADALHPGYGFLSESAVLADACADAGIAFVGPPAAAIRAMGRKDAAQATMAAAAIPVLPGYRGADQDDDALAAEAGRLGLPLIVKPSAGGGGKGMRVVRQQGELLAALAGARREAAGAFGDAHLVLERYLEHPRHVEVQVFCDAHGGAVHLLERDCSVQRRHQKVLEEAPAPGLPGSLRARMGEVAVRAARAIGYVGAGTVEFLLDAAGGTTVTDDTSFYFMEMNTRLQVEHPVTEMILGLDLVEWQLRVAAGEPLPCTQTDIAPSGHAIEARIYAEDPGNDFLPSTGRIRALHEPDARPWLRIDSGVKAGDLIGVHYDPMLAKLVVHGADRRHAVEHLRQALAGYDLVGPATNVGFLERVAVHPAFTAGSVDTGFIARHAEELLAGEPAEERALILAAVLAMLQENTGAGGEPAGAPGTPWVRLEDWRLNASPWREIVLTTEAGDVPVRVAREADAFAVTLGEERHLVRARPGPHGRLGAEMHGQRVTLRWLRDGSTLRLHGAGLRCVVGVRDSDHRTRLAQAEGGHLTAPMPGKVVRVLVTQGERVRAGQALVVIEAMKMEHTVASATAGTVVRIDYEEGDQVEEGVELVVVEAPAASE